MEFINKYTNETQTDVQSIQENSVIIALIIIVIILTLFIVLLIYTICYRKQKNINSKKNHKQYESKETNSIKNSYEDINYDEFVLHEYYESNIKPNIYVEILNDTQSNE